jgi:hypothetical protein
MVSYSPFLSLFRTADALTAAKARIASLEAELDASRKVGMLPLLPRSLLRRLLSQQQPRQRKLRRHLLMLIRGVFEESKP